jgi:hypothetical protein
MMLQFAFGPGPAGAKSTGRAAAPAHDALAAEGQAQLLALATAAQAWWESGRPAGWSLEQHLADPAAGRDGSEAERALAEAVGQWLRRSS